MSEPCPFCGGPVNPHDIGTWKQVMGWVSGPKAHGMTMREYTGKYAHAACITKAKAGQAPDQPSMLDEPMTDAEISASAAVTAVNNSKSNRVNLEIAEVLFSDAKSSS